MKLAVHSRQVNSPFVHALYLDPSQIAHSPPFGFLIIMHAVFAAHPVDPLGCAGSKKITLGGARAASYAGRYTRGLNTTNEGQYRLCAHPGLLRRNCTVLSFGVEQDISFEADLTRQSECVVHAFDPTASAANYVMGVQKSGQMPARVQFHRLGLWNASQELAIAVTKGQQLPMRSLRAILSELSIDKVEVMKLGKPASNTELCPLSRCAPREIDGLNPPWVAFLRQQTARGANSALSRTLSRSDHASSSWSCTRIIPSMSGRLKALSTVGGQTCGTDGTRGVGTRRRS